MAKRLNQTGRNNNEPFVKLPHFLLRCRAWKTLSPNAGKLLLDVWMRHNGTNNGAIPYAVREAIVIGLSSSVAARCFHELIDRGFLVMCRGSTFNLKTREAREWRLTAERCGDDPATKDFMKWAPSAATDCERKTQSQNQRLQSRGRNSNHNGAGKSAATVPIKGLSERNQVRLQSPKGDTYNMPSPALQSQDFNGADYDSLGAQVRAERGLRGWTQRDLAKRSNVSQSYISHLESGKRKIPSEIVQKLLQTFADNSDAEVQDSIASLAIPSLARG